MRVRFGRVLALIVLLLFSLVLSFGNVEGRRLIWNDEFNNSTLDETKWSYEEGQRHSAYNYRGAVRVENGSLIIKAYRENGVYYTGIITTEGHFEAARGYWEARIMFGRQPRASWADLWLYSHSVTIDGGDPVANAYEIDILEKRSFDYDGKDISGLINSAIHWSGYSNLRKNLGTDSGDRGLNIGWHIYGLEANEGGFIWFIDDKEYWRAVLPPTNKGMFIILSVELSNDLGGWVRGLPATLKEDVMFVDFIRYYDKRE